MFHPTRAEVDTGDAAHPRPASASTSGHRTAIASGPVAKRRPHYDVLPRIAAARGWRATFMSI